MIVLYTTLYFALRGLLAGGLFGILYGTGVIVTAGGGFTSSDIFGGLLFGVIYGALVGGIVSASTGLIVGLVALVTTRRVLLIAVAALAAPALLLGAAALLFQGSPIDTFFIAPVLALALINGGLAFYAHRKHIAGRSAG